ncbi:MAG TPA: ADP-ribosylglycohydrolase family protein [Candidatus Dependentiae bacterium]|nr:ADP-ribosylglycohydrolase family protein [Candidatus Dependentiae bacterium]
MITKKYKHIIICCLIINNFSCCAVWYNRLHIPTVCKTVQHFCSSYKKGLIGVMVVTAVSVVLCKKSSLVASSLRGLKNVLTRVKSLSSPSTDLSTEERISGHINAAMLAAATGDALGRVTEFLTLDAIEKRYPAGIHSLKDVVMKDKLKDGRSFAPYTDDTRMAILVMQELIKARHWASKQAVDSGQDVVTFIKDHYEDVCHYIMTHIALSFIKDSHDQWGWTAGFRAPGNACRAGADSHLNILKTLYPQGELPLDVSSYPKNWWRLSNDAGGCGSVMHAYPFGLVFPEDPELAARLAAEHSYLSHAAPIAVSACATMAAGTAYALQGMKPQEVVQRMYSIAKQYDDEKYKSQTAPLISQALEWAHTRKNHEEVFDRFRGWAAHEAVAAAAYIFASSPNDIQRALDLGVHTPGDSDSIASLAGVLVGARVGMSKVPRGWEQYLEDAQLLSSFGRQIVQYDA